MYWVYNPCVLDRLLPARLTFTCPVNIDLREVIGVMLVKVFQTKMTMEIYFKGSIRAVGKVLLMKIDIGQRFTIKSPKE